MWSFSISDSVVEIWRKDSAKISFHRKEETSPQSVLTWLYEIAALNTQDITDPSELRSFVDMISDVSNLLIPP